MNKNLKTIISLALTVLMLFSSVVKAEAGWNRIDSYSYTKGALWWKKNYTVKIYENTSSYYRIYYGNMSVSTGFDWKPNYKEPIVIQQTANMSLSSQTVITMNPEIEFESFGFTSKMASELGVTSSVSWGIANAIGRRVSADDPIGYYSYNVLLNTKYLSFDIYEDGEMIDEIRAYAPDSEPYRAIVYSTNGKYSTATKFY